jgi:hypothetical protein
MKDLLLSLLHLAVIIAKLCGPGGVRAVIAENLLLKQQLIVLRRARQRAPNLTLSDRVLYGFGSLFLGPERIRKIAELSTRTFCIFRRELSALPRPSHGGQPTASPVSRHRHHYARQERRP